MLCIIRPSLPRTLRYSRVPICSLTNVTRSVLHERRNSLLSSQRYADAPLSLALKANIEHDHLTEVQAASLKPALQDKDLLVQAKTGTGKTLAFLIPIVEKLQQRKSREGICAVVMAPTRDLAMQIEEQARRLLVGSEYSVAHAVGGTDMKEERRQLTRKCCDILVATPGRLLDHLSDASFVDKVSALDTLVYDEVDRLLEEGFKQQLDAIVELLPSAKGSPRQTMMFSATIDENVKTVAASHLEPAYEFIKTFGEDEAGTHEHVPQAYHLASFADSFPVALSVLQDDMEEHSKSTGSGMKSKSKAIVFLPTTRQVDWATAVFKRIRGLPAVYDIHGRMTLQKRNFVAEAFRKAESAILVSSDVTARGMDFPGVTLVLQVGIPNDAEQYIHRLGRTARAGASGRGVIVLDPSETFFLSLPQIRRLPLKRAPPLPADQLHILSEAVAATFAKVPSDVKADAYRAWLSYYASHTHNLRWSRTRLVEEALDYVVGGLGWHLDYAPPIAKSVATMLRLGEVRGVEVVRDEQLQSSKEEVKEKKAKWDKHSRKRAKAG
ncbi:P-loop containing nucleoside triphosphate hydrolase protein [Schizophyllum amplum]|uniref:ATP-dependent RNA helicase n=1 Tax=Schizophyllum amplum TaxID=97359 RepID=A0A550CSH4_9AGAR|nr:P-loop containing nucleoside triphosphate hydrolase protein [Auriculariopsis ampla]